MAVLPTKNEPNETPVDEDARDAAVARARLKEIEKNPGSLITDEALKAQLDDLQT